MSSENGKILITPYKNKIVTLLIKNNRLIFANAFPEEGGILGNIYIGKITNVVKNIDAAFVEISPGLVCFLPLKECGHAFLCNRIFDGRILAGDEIVVQVTKDAVKTKQPSVSANLSFSGTYCVVTTGNRKTGYSLKFKKAERERIEAAVGTRKELLDTEHYGYVFRTNCAELNGEYEPLWEEVRTLTKEADSFLQSALHRTCGSLLQAAPAPYLSALNSVYRKEYAEIVTDDKKIYEQLCTQTGLEDIRFYEDEVLPLKRLYAVETKLSEALARNVWLKSGGYLVIEPTEALTVIDVNTGKSIGKKASSEHFFQINKEAAEEIALQLRLRNLSGIIIADFINMDTKEKEEELILYLKALLKTDSVKTKVVDITPLGLVEITRQKINKPLAEQLC